MPTPPTTIRTVGALRASGHASRPVREELRANLLARLRENDTAGLHLGRPLRITVEEAAPGLMLPVFELAAES